MSIQKSLKKAVKKTKTKEEILNDMRVSEKVAHIKDIVATAFPHLENCDTIYDGQTVVNALAGFIDAHIENKLKEIKLGDVAIDLSHEEDSKIKTAMLELMLIFKDEPAKELSQTLERFGRTLAEFGAHKFLKQPMSEIKISDILA